jgi:outer membrane protein assembly factor BamB
MNFIKKETLKNIRSYKAVSNNLLLYCNSSDTFFVNGKPFATNVLSFFSWLDVICYFQHPKTIFVDHANNIVGDVEGSVWTDTYNGMDFIVSKNLGQIRQLGISSFSGKKIINKREINGKFVIGRRIRLGDYLWHTQDRTTIKLLSLQTGEYIWGTDLKISYPSAALEELTILQLIGIYEEQLLVSLSNRELLSLNIHTGKVLWQTHNFVKAYLSDRRNTSFFSFVYWTLGDGKLYQLDGNTYLSMDISTQKVEVLWRDSAEENFLTIIHKMYTEDYIFFTGSRNHALVPELCGIFDRRSLKIKAVHQVDGLTGSLSQPPQIEGNDVYVLDSGGTLHIYEVSE